jgi:hypothetical protein
MYGENEENQENPARVAGVSFDIWNEHLSLLLNQCVLYDGTGILKGLLDRHL